mmetsp:Transcript_654/g.1565  ORF Transcript_654/g.1565 Transcript_654/m.1565 type:complete len:205 (-) Transcript_654:41-655(-)
MSPAALGPGSLFRSRSMPYQDRARDAPSEYPRTCVQPGELRVRCIGREWARTSSRRWKCRRNAWLLWVPGATRSWQLFRRPTSQGLADTRSLSSRRSRGATAGPATSQQAQSALAQAPGIAPLSSLLLSLGAERAHSARIPRRTITGRQWTRVAESLYSKILTGLVSWPTFLPRRCLLARTCDLREQRHARISLGTATLLLCGH